MERVCKSWHYGLSGLKVQFTLSLLQSHREIFFVTRAITGSGTVNSKSFVGKVLLQIKRKFELN